MIRVFVYGTLLAGESNHPWLDGALFLREARTAPGYALVNLGPYPALVAGGSGAVSGEVYEIDDPMLAALDHLEGYPELYDRQPIELADGEFVLSYLMRPEQVRGVPAIASGNWRTGLSP